MSDYGQIIKKAQIRGSFYGFDGETLFHLNDGTYWLQSEYKYWYYYAYCPQVEIFRQGGACYLRVSGHSEAAVVKAISGVLESRIDDAFVGWDGDSEYELTNGQIWKQARYKYQYKYMYRPEILIYPTSGGIVMDVDGSKAFVKRIR